MAENNFQSPELGPLTYRTFAKGVSTPAAMQAVEARSKALAWSLICSCLESLPTNSAHSHGPTLLRWEWLRLRLTANLLKQFNLICPVQSRLQKYFDYRFTQISNIPSAIPLLQRGVSRSSRTLVRDAVDAGGALDETR